MKASELDEKFDNGEDILDYLDLTKATRPNMATQRSAWILQPQWSIASTRKQPTRADTAITDQFVDRRASVRRSGLEKGILKPEVVQMRES